MIPRMVLTVRFLSAGVTGASDARTWRSRNGFRPRDFVDTVALALEHLVDPAVREGEIPLLGFLDGLFLPRLIQQLPEPGSDHGHHRSTCWAAPGTDHESKERRIELTGSVGTRTSLPLCPDAHIRPVNRAPRPTSCASASRTPNIEASIRRARSSASTRTSPLLARARGCLQRNRPERLIRPSPRDERAIRLLHICGVQPCRRALQTTSLRRGLRFMHARTADVYSSAGVTPSI